MAKDFALAYGMKKRKREEEGGEEPEAQPMQPKPRAEYGDMYEGSRARSMEQESKRARAIRMFEGGEVEAAPKKNEFAEEQDERELNQHGAIEQGPQGSKDDWDSPESGVDHPVENQDDVEDMVGRIVAQRQQSFAKGGEAHQCSGSGCQHFSHGGVVKKFSEGGKVANDTSPITDDMPAQYDDLVLRDDLESSYTGENSGDELGNEALDEEEEDLIAKIMKSRSKKDSMPRPA